MWLWRRNARDRVECQTTTQSRQLLKGLVTGHVIRIASLNIRLGRAGGLETALRQGNVGVGIIQDTKLTNKIHTRYGSGYLVWSTEAEIHHFRGGAVVWQEEAGWQVEGVVNFGPNVVSFLLTSGVSRWYNVGLYVPPNDVPAVHQA